MPTWNYGHRREVHPVADAPALDVHDLFVMYPDNRRIALRGVSLRVPVGSRVALVGSNGAGKSTLLKAIAGLLPVVKGRILIYGNPVGACHHRVAYLPQRAAIDWRFPMTLRRLVVTGRYVHLGWFRRPTRRDWEIADEMIEQLGLTKLRHSQIGQLSGGQQQRALMARALAQEASLLLLDEPLNAVDAHTSELVLGTLEALRQRGCTIVAATHDVEHVAAHFDGVLSLRDGRKVPLPTDFYTQVPLAGG
jgi:manganese/zinc/iron transport system ATP- binding protein